MLNRFVVSALMNAFPNTATKIFSLSKGKLARLLFAEREGGSFLVLRAMYEHEGSGDRGDLINRLLMQSPAIKAARNRRIIAQRMLFLALQSLPPDAPSLILAIGGGDGSLEAEVLARADNPNGYLCIVDKDERAIRENAKILKIFGLSGKGVVFVGSAGGKGDLETLIEKAGRHFGVRFDGLGITVCQGITEYLDIGSQGNEAFAGLLSALYGCTRKEGVLLLSQTDYHDRVTYLERGLSWRMRLRGQDEIAVEIEKAGWKISVCEPEPMKLITMCSAVKTDRANIRIDSPSQIGPPRRKRPMLELLGIRKPIAGRR